MENRHRPQNNGNTASRHTKHGRTTIHNKPPRLRKRRIQRPKLQKQMRPNTTKNISLESSQKPVPETNGRTDENSINNN